MKVKALIETLQTVDPESEIAVYYWTEEGLEEWFTAMGAEGEEADNKEDKAVKFSEMPHEHRMAFMRKFIPYLEDWDCPPQSEDVDHTFYKYFNEIEKELSTYRLWLEKKDGKNS